MNETTYVQILDLVLGVSREGRRAILDALFADLQPDVRECLAIPLWSWSCDAPPAFDLALGDEHDVIRAALEFKSPSAAVNWGPISTARSLPFGSDPLSQEIRRKTVDQVPERFDDPHDEGEECLGNGHEDIRDRATGRWRAAMHQGDLYRACLPGVSGMHRPEDLTEVTFVLVVPDDSAAARWLDGLISCDDAWQIVRLPEVLLRWQSVAETHAHVRVLVDATRRFLGAT